MEKRHVEDDEEFSPGNRARACEAKNANAWTYSMELGINPQRRILLRQKNER
jgi:hypothetical protein